MQTTSLRSHLLLPFPRSSPPHNTTRRTLTYASKKDSFGHQYDDGKLVDENMILLRLRIREIELVEMKGKTPSHWSEWENKLFPNYDSHVFEAVGFLQRMLINTRPSFALAMLALVTLAMSSSISLLLFHSLQFAKGIM